MPDGGSRIRGIATAGALVASAYLAARRFGRRATVRARAERRFGVLMQNSSDVIAVIRADGVVDYVSPSIEKITGLGPEERVGRSAFDLIHPEDVGGVRADMADLLRRPGGTATGEFRMLHADGGVRHVEAVAVNRVDDADVGGIVVNYRDVTARRRAEEDRLRLAAIVGSSEDAITSGDLRGTVMSWNPGAERLYGLSAREAVGRPVREAMKPLDPETIPRNIALVERGETVGPFDAVHHDRDGRALSVSVTLSPIRTPGGGVTGVAAVTRDVAKRDEAEKALRASEERFRTAFENAPLGVALTDLDGRFLRANRALRAMLGYAEEELARTTSLEITHPDDRRESSARARRIFETDPGMQTQEKRYVCKDGRVVWTLSSISLVRDAGGDPSHFIALYQDITGRKRAEDRLRETEERFRTLVEQIPAVTYIDKLDEVSTSVYISPQVERMLGFTPEERMENPRLWVERLHPEDRGRVLEANDRSNASGEPFDMEYRMVTRDGRVVWVHDGSVVLPGSEGRPPYRQGVMFDITDRREAEERLEQAERGYRLLVEKVPAVVYLDGVDKDNSAIYRSPHVREVLGYEPGEFLEDPEFWHRLLHPDDRERVLRENERTNRTGEPFKIEYRMVCKDGRVVWLRDEAVLIRDAAGRPLHWQGIFMDITARKRAEDEIKEANRRLEELAVLKADFTAMVAHELDTPLAVIRGYADVISTGELDAGSLQQATSRIRSETEVLNALVEDVRAAANVERQDFAVDPRPVPVDDLLADAAAFAGSLSGGHELVVRAGVAGAVRADRYRIGQVLRNLLSNAAKYSPDGAPIGLRVLAGQDGRVRFEVFDRGGGISPEDAARIFEKFGRGRDGRKQAGLGLGLYLSRRILRAHGGDLTLHPDPEGGSVFGFELEAEG